MNRSWMESSWRCEVPSPGWWAWPPTFCRAKPPVRVATQGMRRSVKLAALPRCQGDFYGDFYRNFGDFSEWKGEDLCDLAMSGDGCFGSFKIIELNWTGLEVHDGSILSLKWGFDCGFHLFCVGWWWINWWGGFQRVLFWIQDSIIFFSQCFRNDITIIIIISIFRVHFFRSHLHNMTVII